MTQRLHTILLLILTLVVAYTLYNTNSQRLVYVDSARLLAKYQRMVDARKAYQKKATAWQTNVDTLAADVQTAIRQYEHSLTASSFKDQNLAKELIRTKQKRLKDYQQSTQQTAQQEEAQATQEVIKQVNAFLDQYGKDHGYDLILVANQTGNIAYARSGLDITEQVTTQLNKQYIKTGL